MAGVNLPPAILEAIQRDITRQQQAGHEAERNLVAFAREAVLAASKLGEDQAMDDGQLDMFERNVRQFIMAIRKCSTDAASTQQYLNSLEEANE